MEVEVEIQEPEFQQEPDPPKKKLWKSLSDKHLYTKSYDDFGKQFSTPESIDKLHKVLSEKQLYTKTTDDFKTQFFSDVTPQVKKKSSIDFGGSSLEAGNALSQSNGVGGGEIPPVGKNDIDIALEYGKLKGATKWGATPSSGKAGETFGEIPDEEKRKSANKLAEDFKGVDLEGLSQEFSDFPEAAFDRETTSKKELLRLRKENPIQYASRLNNAKTVYKIAEKSDIATANRFNQLSDIEYGSLDGFISGKRQQQDIINQTLTGFDKEKATKRLQENASRFINSFNPDLVDEYENSELKGVVDANQYAGLKTWEVFEPEKYKQAIAMLKEPIVPQYQYEVNVTPDEKQKGITTDSALAAQYGGKLMQATINQQIGKETVLRQLNVQGLQNAEKDIKYRQAELIQRNKETKDEIEKFQIAQDYLETEQELEGLRKAQKDEDAKYPYTAQLKFDQQVKNLTQDRGASVGELMYNRYAHGIGSTVDAAEDLTTTLFGSESDKAKLRNKRIGEQSVFEGSVYLPPNEQRINPEEILVATDALLKKVKDVLNGRSLSSLSPEERKKVNDIVAANQSEIETITNPEAGKSKNFFSKATALSVASFTSDIAAFMTNMGMFKGVGLGGKLAEATTLFKDGYNEAFNKKIKEGASVNAANEYAMLHGGILALMAKFGSKYDAVQNMLKGGKSPLSKQIAGISEETWNNIANENKGVLSRLASSGKSIAKENIKMTGTYGVLAPTVSSLADNVFYDQHKSIKQMASEAATTAEEIVIGSLGFMISGLSKGALKPTATPLEKASLWELGDNPELGKAKIDEAVKLNDLTKEEGEIRKGSIDKVSKLIDKVPIQNDKGKPLTDNQKTTYLYNLLIKETAKEQAKSLPEKQAEVKDKEGLVADFNNQILLANSSEKQLTSRKAELENRLSEKDDKGKLVISEQDKIKVEAEIEAIDSHLDSTKKEELPDLSVPIEGTDKKGVPIGEDVPAETKPTDVKNEAKESERVSGSALKDVEKVYNEKKQAIEDKLNQQLEDNKDRLDDIDEKGGTKTVRQKIYQEHTNEMVELEKWKMKEDLKNEKLESDKTKKDAVDEMVDFADNNLGKDNTTNPTTGKKLFELNKERLNNAVSGLRDKIANGTLRQVTKAIQTVREVLNVSFNINNRELGKQTEQKIDDIGIRDAKKRTDKELLDHVDELENVKRYGDSYVSYKDTRGDTQYMMGNDNFDPYLTEAVNRGLVEIKDGKLTNNGKAPTQYTEAATPKEQSKPTDVVVKLEAERDAEIDKVSKPDFKLELVKTEDLVNSKDPIGNREKHNELKERYKNLRKLIDCL